MKILICDDDISTINVITNQMDWEKLGISSVLRAYDGVAAKEMLDEEKPEIVLCDIDMPRCNGIGVLKYIHDNNIPAELVFLTCHESFEYARDAIRYGAVNYLTKPIDLNDLTYVLQGLVASVRTKKEKNHTRGADALVNNLLGSICNGLFGTDAQRISAALKREGIHTDAYSRWRVVCVCGETTNARRNGWTDDLLRYAFPRLAQETIADRMDMSWSIPIFGDRFDIVTLFIPATQFSEQELTFRCKKMAELAMEHMNVNPVFLISEEVPLYQFSDVVPQLHKRIRRTRLDAGKVHFSRDPETKSEETVFQMDASVLLSQINRRDKTGFMELVNAAATKIVQSRKNVDMQMSLLRHDLLQVIYDYLRDNQVGSYVVFKDESMRKLQANAERSVFDMMTFSSSLFELVTEAVGARDEDTDLVRTVKQYIQEHYKENVDRNEIAAAVFVSPNYLSRCFRAETGTNLREYINQLRIEEAKRLLLSTNYTVGEIACEVGFENMSYFSTVFRKISGMTPVDWVKSVKERSKNP